MRDLEQRIRHSTAALQGEFTIPELNEIRKVRGLELLSTTVRLD
jgi:hypothetical protein